MFRLRVVIALIIIGSLGLGWASMLIPPPPGAVGTVFYAPEATAVAVASALLSFGSSVLFLMALKSFKPELKPAYLMLAFSNIAIGIGNLMFQFIEYFALWSYPIFNLLTYIPNMLGVVLLYIGIRMFYKRVGLGGLPSNVWAMLGVIVVLAVLHSFLPSSENSLLPQFPKLIHDIWLAIPIGGTILYIATAAMALRLRHKTGQAYAMAFGWLAFGVILYAWSTASVVVVDTTGFNNWYFENRIVSLAPTLTLVIFLVCAYYFNAIGYPAEQRRGWLRRIFSKAHPVTSFDLIVFVARQSSNIDKLGAHLDVMRRISANTSGQKINDADQAKLKDLYLKIEDQLAAEDALRDFSKDQLRADIVKHFALDRSAEGTFWPLLQSAK